MKLQDKTYIIKKPLQLLLVLFMISSAYIADLEQLNCEYQVEISNEIENIENEELAIDELLSMTNPQEDELSGIHSIYFHLNLQLILHNSPPTTPPPEVLI